MRTLLLVSFLLISACSSKSVDEYAGTLPAFNMKSFFVGELVAYGMVQNRQGDIIRRFTATIDASWQGNALTLDEKFVFSDGEKSVRVWKIEDLGDGRYQGTANDVKGVAIGIAKGAVFRWQYVLPIEVDGTTYDIHLDDWLYQISDTHLLNKTKMSKWGIDVGDITLVIHKV